ncbi:aminoglycoside phosphotransferase family protein [Shewanella chilikensis]|uniref:aminoglycoside phosphotransferase family protein n=1 Tax=Shewanella chilikensis TaxID=558541 RepID=UPI00399BBB18
MTLSDPRFLSMSCWLQQLFGKPLQPKLISGDASFRRYFRLNVDGRDYIVTDSPPNLLDNKPFIALARAYHQAGIRVPKVLEFNEAEGFILQQDLGDKLLLPELTETNVSAWYLKALAILPDIAAVRESELGPLPDYDAAFVERELAIFSEWLLDKHWQVSLTAAEHTMLTESFAILTASALAQPQVGMHRDFHSRNLMLKDGKLWVIDFQDAVLGPVTYDAVSLLRDCYIRWPDAIVEPLLKAFFEQCREQGVVGKDVDFATFSRWFDLMGVQRHLKAAGIFARLHHRDGKSGYLKDIPLTLGYVADICERYPQLQALSSWVRLRLLPLTQQPAQPESQPQPRPQAEAKEHK